MDGAGDIGTDHTWTAEASRHNLRNLQVGAGGQINEPAVVDAFNSGALNPFVFNVPATEEAIAAFEAINTTTFREGTSNLQTYSLTFDGILPLELAGGEVGYAAGYEFRKEKFLDRADNLSKEDKILGAASSDGKGDRENTAFYAEFLLPVVDNVDVNTAIRFDSIDNKEEAFTYKLGVAYAVMKNLKLRASVGTGFKAPGMHELYLGKSFGVTEAVDVQTCGSSTPCEINTEQGGNEELEPEESTNFNFGVISQLTDTLALSVDYWDITIENKVDSLSLQSILNDPSKFGDLIVRDANGRLNTTGAFVRTNLQNLTKEHSAGLEVQLSHSESTSVGRFKTTVILNKLMKSETQETAADPMCDYSELQKAFDGRVVFGWSQDALGVDAVLRHYGARVSYAGGKTAGTCDWADETTKFDIESTNELDLQVSYNTPWDTLVALGVNNVTATEPAYDENETWPWFSQDRYSNIGRFMYVSATHEFK